MGRLVPLHHGTNEEEEAGAGAAAGAAKRRRKDGGGGGGGGLSFDLGENDDGGGGGGGDGAAAEEEEDDDGGPAIGPQLPPRGYKREQPYAEHDDELLKNLNDDTDTPLASLSASHQTPLPQQRRRRDGEDDGGFGSFGGGSVSSPAAPPTLSRRTPATSSKVRLSGLGTTPTPAAGGETTAAVGAGRYLREGKVSVTAAGGGDKSVLGLFAAYGDSDDDLGDDGGGGGGFMTGAAGHTPGPRGVNRKRKAEDDDPRGRLEEGEETETNKNGGHGWVGDAATAASPVAFGKAGCFPSVVPKVIAFNPFGIKSKSKIRNNK
jgi:hypothetical protein